MIVDPILLSGPSITHREIECAAEAAAVGWNIKAAGYVQKLQKRMARYTGHRYAFATSSCTGALHLALMAVGLGPGDEVLVPEIADFSVAACVVYTGATPVFCDVDPLTLCMSPESAAARVTNRTKAMIPVHMYGQPCDMDALMNLAAEHKLYVIEDATQGLGGMYKGRRAGSFGLFSTFSFNSTKPVVSGEGGMLLSSNIDAISRAAKLGNHGRNEENPNTYDFIGFNYAMSNMAAAVGYAQMERIDELVAKKREIYGWYKERLQDMPGVRLNAELPDSESSFWMTVLFLEDPAVNREEFIKRLIASRVVSRPVFYPLSSMKMFTRADNPAAYGIGSRALVLPSGHNRTEEEVEYIVSVIKGLLNDRNASSVHPAPTGWLKYKSDVMERFMRIKRDGFSLPFTHDGQEYELKALTVEDTKKQEVIDLLTKLRQDNLHAFLGRFPVTEEQTREAMGNYLEKARDFLMFLVTGQGRLYGHMGLDDFDFKKRECVAEAFMMLPDAPRGLAAAGAEVMYAWGKKELKLVRVYNHVVGSNTRVRLLAAVQGFKEVNKTSLYRVERENGCLFRPMYIMGHDKPDEYFVFSAKDL